jgi:hypothetical protein
MRIFRSILCLATLWLPLTSSAAEQTENIRARISEAEFIVNICIYKHEWVPPTAELPKAILITRAVVTGVFKGTIPIGTKLEYRNYIEEPQRFLERTKFRPGPVEGELVTFFFSSEDGTLKDGKYILPNAVEFSFPRCDAENDFAKAFREELKTNPGLKPSND